MSQAPCAIAAVLVGLCLVGPAAAGNEPATWQTTWAEMLTGYTRSVPETAGTVVDYRALKDGPESDRWRGLVRAIGKAAQPGSREERLALWINAYNILAIDTVVRSYPVESIRDVGSLFRPVWKREAGIVAGRTVSLGEIEHEILRPLGDPRIHAAIVCASTSCPSLRRTPFTAADLDLQLDESMRRWLLSPTKGLSINRAATQITLSPIFDWFEEDFARAGGVRSVVTRYAPERDRAWLLRNAASADLAHFDYDWSLNAAP